MKVGFIGTGSMGGLLIEAFIESGVLKPEQIAAANRTFSKVERLATYYPGLRAVSSNKEALLHSDCLFLCIKPSDFKCVVDELRPYARPEQLIVSITSPVLISHLEDWLPCKIAKVIPSITNRIMSGASLCMYGSRIQPADRNALEQLLSGISEPIFIEERFTRVVSDLSSCGPAFIAFLLQRLIDAAVAETGIEYDDAVSIASSMLLGTGRLLTEGGLTPKLVQQRVAVPGGITEQALKLLHSETDEIFNKLIRTTHAKFKEDLEKVQASFYGEEVNGPTGAP
ncbi:late competence protein ComER [Paenibacillus beijingensis]|uniref:Pyrroline-5-carboxylate reductase n=1 Tax=Paenibacillus beijingensis TaxID=1126833 RepID=A0A0D5NLR1_9BACL|nr:late competence protein ComER [Paenibacillus beijingensis]AJY76259.1 competence protein [Paenibacillus beijingensis]